MRRVRLCGWVAVVALLLASACQNGRRPDAVEAAGQVEATEVRVAPEVGGRLVSLEVDEGSRVKAGQLLGTLDTRDTELALARARADRDAAAAGLALLRAGARPEEIREAEAQAAAAEAQVGASRAELSAAREDLDRFEHLLQANAGSRKQRDDAATRVQVGQETVKRAEEQARSARETLARIRAGARREELAQGGARVAAADAQIATLDKQRGDARVVSPASGIVTEKLAEVGEMVAARVPIVVITDLDHAWANLYVPEPSVPRLRIGQRVTVRTDAGGQGVDGRLTYVSPNAEFTPRNVQTAEERSKQVYRVKVTVDNREGVLKAGMPVHATLTLAAVP
ncbi:MAG: HlyD family efflux transporter periplasmic adaptor subunit [Luteitalea sp.]|nr:HlyD family efflux transporter periplasmic adaptor subunit [Luteitalea sp.]